MARTVKTKGGRTLTDADIERFARQAEQGFDLSRWRPRRGRPSLSAPEGGHSPRIGARVSDDVYRRATERAAAEGKSISEVVRELLDGYAEGRELAAPRRRRSN
jgi:predicted HicB family RNase H-like nuclease